MADGRVVAEAAFGTPTLSPLPLYTELTSRLRDEARVVSRRGRQNRLQTFNPGVLGFGLQNHDRLFDPSGSGVYAPFMLVNTKVRLSSEYPWLPGAVPNPDFEQGITGWTVTGAGSIADNTAFSYLEDYGHIHCCQITAGNATGSGTRSGPITVDSDGKAVAAGSIISGSARCLPQLMQLLTANQSSLETNTTGWAAFTNTTISRVTTQHDQGTAALQLSSTGAGDMSASTPTGTGGFACIGGAEFSCQCRVKSSAVARTIQIRFVWYDSTGAFISSTNGANTTSNTTTFATVTNADAVAPMNASYYAIQAYVVGCAGAAEVHWFDTFQVGPGATNPTWTLGTGPITRQCRIVIEWFSNLAGTTANGTSTGTSASFVGRGNWGRVPGGPFTAPAGTLSYRVRVEMTGTWVATELLLVDAVVMDTASFTALTPFSVGYVDSWAQDNDGVRDAWCTVAATDAFKLFGRDKLNISGYADAVLSDSPTHYWRFSEGSGATSFRDLGTSPQTAFAFNTPASAASLLKMDSDPSIGIALNNGIELPGCELTAYPFTIEMLIQWDSVDVPDPNSLGWTYIPILMQKNIGPPGVAGTVQFSFGIYTAAPGKPLLYDWYNPDTGGRATLFAYNGFPFDANHVANLIDGKVHHLIYNAVNATTVVTTIDGQQAGYGSLTSKTPGATSLNTLYLGQGPDGEFTQWFGNIDELAIYAGVSLSGSSQANHYLIATGWGNESSGARLNRILDLYGWPSAFRNIDAGAQTIIAADENLLSTRTLAYMQQIEQAEAGKMFMAKDGKVRFINRRAGGTTPYNTVQGIFGNGAGEIPYSTLSPNGPIPADDQLLINHSEYTRKDGPVQFAEDAASRAQYGLNDASVSGVIVPLDTDALALAQLDIFLHSEPRPRIDEMTFKLVSDAAWAEFNAREIGDLIEFRWRPVGLPSGYVSYLMAVEGINVSFARGVFEVGYQLSNVGAQPGWLVLNDATLGKLNTGVLAA